MSLWFIKFWKLHHLNGGRQCRRSVEVPLGSFPLPCGPCPVESQWFPALLPPSGLDSFSHSTPARPLFCRDACGVICVKFCEHFDQTCLGRCSGRLLYRSSHSCHIFRPCCGTRLASTFLFKAELVPLKFETQRRIVFPSRTVSWRPSAKRK